MPTHDLTGAGWRKSARSGQGSDGDCVEVAHVVPAVAVRDSERPGSGSLVFESVAWSTFMRTL